MKKLFLITIILLLQSFPSFGEWKKIYSTSDGVSFINTDTIMEKEGIVYYDILTNFFEPQIKSSLSQIVRIMMNCKTKKILGVRLVLYFDPMGKGKVVYEHNFIDAKWRDIKYEGGSNPLYNFLCK